MENEVRDMEALDVVTNEDIKNMIYTIRGKQVMLDSDVAKLYHYETKYINLAVKRNIKRFPGNFCFQLTENELDNLRLQFATSSLKKENYGGRRYLPNVFTAEGIAMLAGILKNEIAIEVSIKIINAFIEMRKMIRENVQVYDRLLSLEYKQKQNEKKFEEIFNMLQNTDKIKQRIFFQGQIYDAYSLIIDIIKEADKKIVIIDNYADISVLKMLSKKKVNVEVVILTSDKSNIQNIDIQKFNKQYPTLKIAKTNKFHDRFIIIDEKELYHCGASIKDLGKKCFAISKIEDKEYLKKLIKEKI